jgi:hypothetical protein
MVAAMLFLFGDARKSWDGVSGLALAPETPSKRHTEAVLLAIAA